MSSLYRRPDSNYYWWTTRYKGRRVRKSTKMSQKHLAIKVQQHWDMNLIKGDLEFLGSNTLPSTTIGEYFQHYLKFIDTRKSQDTVSVTKGVLNKFMCYLSGRDVKRLDDITVPVINEYIDWLTCAPKTRKNHVNIIALLLDQAIKEGIQQNNPARNATLPEIKKVIRHRLLTENDIEIIFNGAGSWKLYFLYLLHTGQRAGDIAQLTYGNINRKKGIITNYIRKSRKIGEFPLSNVLLAQTPVGVKYEPLFPMLYSIKEDENGVCITDEKVLHYRLSLPREYLQAILKAAGRPKATLHSFRVTYNNILRDMGLSIEDRQILLSHSSSRTTQIYTHPNMHLAKEYVNRLPNPFE